ncbi:hypothetical protein ACMZOO_11325 [Catenovulum sp. SX2]|uniref:hypothetical protein n=1 Tax=Catenovulum sp. SX2 TaxID=3398614 RepID=UPI003F860652
MSFHAFSDGSGCTFYNHITGETASLNVDRQALSQTYFRLGSDIDIDPILLDSISQLIKTGFLLELKK